MISVTGNYSQAQASAELHRAQTNATQQPRELRILERLNGMTGSVNQLASFLEGFTSRLSGCGENACDERPPSAGLFDSMSRIEDGLRRCHELVRKLDDAF